MTSLTCTKHYKQYFECKNCGGYVDYEYELISTNAEEPEGLCPHCRSDAVVPMNKVTVYTEIWVEENDTEEDIIEAALHVEDWHVLDHTIRLKKED